VSEKEKEVKLKFSTLYILPRALKRVMYYAQAADGEVSGLGTIIRDEKGRYIVDDVFLLDQESSGADTDLKPEAISELMVEMMKKNEDPSRLKFWWHSHANMGVFWSGTDDTCAETLSREFAFSLVVNKSGEKLCRLDIYSPIRITINQIKVEELIEEDKSLKEMCEKEVKEKVKSPSYGYHHEKGATGGYLYPNHGRRHPHHIDPYEEYYGSCYRDGRWEDKKKETKVRLPENIVEDITSFVELANENASEGGPLSAKTWNAFIFAKLKSSLEKRFEEKAECQNFATYGDGYDLCTKQCKIAKTCKHWTEYIAKKEEEIAKPSISNTNSIVDESSVNGIID